MFRVVVLGSGASLPTLHRQTSAVAVQFEGDVYLFDCGEGTQLQWRRAGLRFGRLRGIFISHLHGDHLNGLVGLLQTLSLNDREEPLHLFGPSGIADYWAALRRFQGVRLGYPLEIVEADGGQLLETSTHRVEAASLEHGIPTLGFAVVETDKPGRFDVDGATALGVEPGPLFGRLQAGESVTLADGSVVSPDQVLGPPRPGRRLAYCVDTRPCDAVMDLGRRATLLLCDSTFASELADEARGRGHCTAAQAAQMAVAAEAQQLMLTHISARYHDARPLLAEAVAVFEETVLAADLMEVFL
ncbi:MAG TPA: ribonuclease Z [Acidobacteriota bacterium]|nr:ribonuclease Z [Acidobacteriota bacterium]